ncbi:MAG: flavodoxin family protein [Desulfobacteraceae bacterium]
MKVVAFNGSPRKDGNTSYLLKTVLRVLEDNGIETEYFQVGGKPLRGCTACFQCAENQDKKCSVTSDKLNEYLEKMIQADGILVGSPTYFSDLSSETKALLDRACFVALQNGGLFRKKAGAAVVAQRRGGAVHVMDSILKPFQMSEMFIPGSTYWNMGFGLGEGEAAQDDEGVKNMENLGRQLAYLLKVLDLGKKQGVEVR